jgi:hypothetical protein
LLAVAQSGVEDDDVVGTHGSYPVMAPELSGLSS